MPVSLHAGHGALPQQEDEHAGCRILEADDCGRSHDRCRRSLNDEPRKHCGSSSARTTKGKKQMISLSKEESSLVLRIDLDEAPSTVERAWAAFTMAVKLGVPEFAKIGHDAVLLLVAEAIAAHLAASAEKRADHADNPDTHEKNVMH